MELIVGVLSGLVAFVGLGRVEGILRKRRDVDALIRPGHDRRRTDRKFTDREAMGYRVGMGEDPETVQLRRGTTTTQ